MGTTIISNGSKWLGEPPDPIEKLLEVLASHPLNRVFERCGNFIGPSAGGTRFWGNFEGLSHVFDIETDDPDVIGRLTAAIRENQRRPDYLSQGTETHRESMEKGEWPGKGAA